MITLKSVIEDTNTRAGRIFDICIQILIFLSLVTFSIGTIPDLSENTQSFLRIFEIVTVLIFSIEYILRIIVSDKKLKYIFSFYGIIDLLAVLPFYLSMGIDLRSLRILRLFRLFRIIKLVRYTNALQRFRTALQIAREELLLFFIATALLLFLSGAGIYFFENPAQPEVFSSIFSSLWWAVGTLTTVGYGDIYPITAGGKIFTFIVLMIGLGIVAVPAGILSSSLLKARELETPKENEL